MNPEEARSTSTESRDAPWYGFRRALVAHGDPQARTFLKEALSRAGYAADLCEEAGVLLDGGVSGRHSLLVMKSGSPELEALRSLRSRGNTIPALLLSRAALEAEPPLDPEIGGVGRLSMPFTLAMLRTAIARLGRGPSEGGAPTR